MIADEDGARQLSNAVSFLDDQEVRDTEGLVWTLDNAKSAVFSH